MPYPKFEKNSRGRYHISYKQYCNNPIKLTMIQICSRRHHDEINQEHIDFFRSGLVEMEPLIPNQDELCINLSTQKSSLAQSKDRILFLWR